MGRQAITTTPGGTVTHVFFDARGNVTSTWVGTDDAPGQGYDNIAGNPDRYDFRHWVSDHPTAASGPDDTNMVKVSESIYDFGQDGGDELVTQTIAYVGGGSPDRVTKYGYDWRDRSLWTAQSDGAYQTYVYYTYLCPCQLAGADFPAAQVVRRGRWGTERCSRSHSTIAA